MTSSMTAFARLGSEISIGNNLYQIEIRSVNQRFLEINCRLPESLRSLETQIKALTRNYLKRGKVDISINFRHEAGSSNLTLNKDSLANWLAIFADSGATASLGAPDWNTIINLPGVLTEQVHDQQMLDKAILEGINATLLQLIDMRKTEGQKIAEVLMEKLREIENILAAIEIQIPKIEQKISENLHNKLEANKLDIDRNRFEQEIVYLLSKSDIREELDRLFFHIKETRDTLNKDEANGRRLDFLMQEFNREANTLGAKAADNFLSKSVVDLKVIIEQMREQVQNVE